MGSYHVLAQMAFNKLCRPQVKLETEERRGLEKLLHRL